MIYLAAYKGIRPGLGGIVSHLIQFVTQSQYSHTEVCIGDPFEGPVECFSASAMDRGVRTKVMQLNPDKWDLLPLSWVDEATIRQAQERYTGRKYDHLGVARFVLPFLGEHDERWFCSEMSAYVCGFHDSWRYNPADAVGVVASMSGIRG